MKDAKINAHILLCAADDFIEVVFPEIAHIERIILNARRFLEIFCYRPIDFSYEKGDGIKPNPHKASLWRNYLPEKNGNLEIS